MACHKRIVRSAPYSVDYTIEIADPTRLSNGESGDRCEEATDRFVYEDDFLFIRIRTRNEFRPSTITIVSFLVA